MLIYLILGFLALGTIIFVLYNRLIRLRQLVANSWSNVDTELKRRHDLIPNLVETVKGYATHESAVFESVTKARAQAMQEGSDPRLQAGQENVLSQALKSLFAVSESYPELKASASFLALQEELANTEDRIQSARRFYNANVRDYNTKVQTIPSSLVAMSFGFKQAEYFEISDGEAAPISVDLQSNN